MQIRYYLDAETGLPHFYEHGVLEEEVRDILRQPGERRPGRKNSQIAMGQTTAGRYLCVIYSLDDDGDGIFVITAYPMSGKSLKAYRRQRRRRQR